MSLVSQVDTLYWLSVIKPLCVSNISMLRNFWKLIKKAALLFNLDAQK